MSIGLTDAHCHVDFLKSADIENSVFSDFENGGICACACFGDEWEFLKNFSSFPLKKAFGLHPLGDLSNWRGALAELEKFLPFADAVGEAGLDSRDCAKSPLEIQKSVFGAQLDLAENFSKKIVVHCVGAWGAVAEILEDRARVGADVKILIHAANCSAEIAKRLEKIGAYFSFGTRELCLKNGREVVLSVSPERILTESDGVPSSAAAMETLKLIARFRGGQKYGESDSLLFWTCRVGQNFSEFFV